MNDRQGRAAPESERYASEVRGDKTILNIETIGKRMVDVVNQI